MIIVNLKTYEQAYDTNAAAIAQACQKVAADTGIRIVVCPQAVDIRLAKAARAEVFAQHTDTVGFGKHTGWVNPEALKAAGISGTLINHSEHQLSTEAIEATIRRCRELGLTSVVCAATVEKAQQILRLEPDYIAIEPPELIGSDISVSTGRPELIKDSVQALTTSKTKVLVGAGVRTEEDVRVAVRYGAAGILSASEISKSPDPEASLRIFAAGFR
jgi:triosephosphate isomerase (TIM)